MRKCLKYFFTAFLLFYSGISNYSYAQCNDWLKVSADYSGVVIGDLNVTGTQITVEAKLNRIISNLGPSEVYQGDLVSKHNGPEDANYLLRPDDAEITTDKGYFRTPDICDIDISKTYYVAMVYDGATLKFYRNGFLMSQVAASGNLFQNNWITTIGSLASNGATSFPEYLAGYINEVRIWNVAKTQSELQQYMNTSLPNPTTQAGLLAYYQFNSLINLQGNAAWNGTIKNSASINQTNPSCASFVADSCDIVPGSICSNDWLLTPSYPSYVDVGQLNVTGNQITVEADINRTQPYAAGTGNNNDGDIVSKHLDPTNTNYLLRPNHAYITTTNGFFATPDACEIELNKTYHVAMVYDGKTLKYYRNGFLMSEIAATGNLFQNNFPARIGLYPGTNVENFLGYINNVRIWNVARTQAQLQQYMMAPLPNPATQTGLLAYYNFNSLNNLQGNAAWNGIINGSASINQINPTCENFVADSCGQIINTCPSKSLSVDTAFCSGASVSIKSDFNSSNYIWNNSATTGSITISQPGIYWVKGDSAQCNVIDSFIVKENPLPNIFLGNDTSSCSIIKLLLNAGNAGSTYVWQDHSSNQTDSVTKSGVYYVTVTDINKCVNSDTIKVTDLALPVISLANNVNICKGDSAHLIANVSGSNSYSWFPSGGLSNTNISNPNSSPADTTRYFVTVTGSDNCKSVDSITVNVLPKPLINLLSSLNICAGSTTQLNANVSGNNSYSWSPSSTLSNANIFDPVASPSDTTKYFVTVTGIDNCKASDSITVDVLPIPKINLLKDTSICTGSSVQLFANVAGNNSYSWSPSSTLSNANIFDPVASPLDSTKYFVTVAGSNTCKAADSVSVNVLQKPQIISADDTSACIGNSITLQTNSVNATIFQWTPVTGLNNPNIADPVAHAVANIVYTFTAGNAVCPAVSKIINLSVLPLPVVSISNDTTICGSANALLFATGGTQYFWTPATGLSNTNIYNPIASPLVTTNYYVTVTDANKCVSKDSVLISVNPKPDFKVDPPSQSLCVGDSTTFTASGGDIYQWSPDLYINDTSSATPIVYPISATAYSVFIYNNACKVSTTLAANVIIKPSPVITVAKSNDINCVISETNLSATGGVNYTWSPANYLSNPNISDPVATPPATTMFHVNVTNSSGCTSPDSIQVEVLKGDSANGYLVPSAFTPNGDGKNDCFGVKEWGNVKNFELSIYNRWGNLIFHANNTGECWDGTYRGIAQPAGTYIYQIHGETICGNVYRKGTVVLIR